MNEIKVAFFDAKPYDRKAFDLANEPHGMVIKYFKDHLTPETAALARGYDAVCAFVNDTIDAGTIQMLKDNGNRVLSMRCAGYNNVDFQSAFGNIRVTHVPAYSPFAIAEHTVALILSLNRKIYRAYSRTRENNFLLSGLEGFDLHGKTAGIIGTGRIGQIVINILQGFGMKVLAYDKFPNEKASKELGFDYASLDEIYQQSDIISLHCPLTKETEYLVNSDSIAKMKDGVMIINTGRGGLIRTVDLIAGLKTGKIGYAGLDVYEEESEYFFKDFSETIVSDDVLARLLTFNNVIVTSHQAFLTREALANIAATSLENILDILEKNASKNEICYRCTGSGGEKNKDPNKCSLTNCKP